MSNDPSLRDVAEMFRALFPPLYYATEESIERDKMYYIEGSKFSPECIVCHPDDLEEVRAAIHRSLVHLREWKPMLEATT